MTTTLQQAEAAEHAMSQELDRVVVKSVIFTPCSICFHVNGMDTVAFGFARAVNTDARLFPRAFCIQST